MARNEVRNGLSVLEIYCTILAPVPSAKKVAGSQKSTTQSTFCRLPEWVGTANGDFAESPWTVFRSSPPRSARASNLQNQWFPTRVFLKGEADEPPNHIRHPSPRHCAMHAARIPGAASGGAAALLAGDAIVPPAARAAASDMATAGQTFPKDFWGARPLRPIRSRAPPPRTDASRAFGTPSATRPGAPATVRPATWHAITITATRKT